MVGQRQSDKPGFQTWAINIITTLVTVVITLAATWGARANDIESLKTTAIQAASDHTRIAEHALAIEAVQYQLADIKQTQETVRKEVREDMMNLSKKLDSIQRAVAQ